ncbi:hypothetical protein [Natronorubrum tibetense]|uniref:Transporter permease n=1 Tax=Natronorubrum tibetense GA33 TaxID=1114856 RepID=L9W2T3_9EURY|nr:hypothetical protein [Natronorubrum tibetense]ELY43809.1 transporter permease [Natronorubrum tibetense GA33]
MVNSGGNGENDRRNEHRTNGQQEKSFVDDVPWKQALLYGIGAFVLGMALLTGLMIVEGALDDAPTDDSSTESIDEDEPGFMTIVSWLYFGTQFVDVEMSWALGTESMNLLDEASEEMTIPTIGYYLVPIVALVGMGKRLAETTLPATTSPEEGAKRGATITAGYLLAVVLAAQLFTWSATDGEMTVSAGADFTQALLLAGLIYPVLFGAIGGYLAFRE